MAYIPGGVYPAYTMGGWEALFSSLFPGYGRLGGSLLLFIPGL